MSRWVSGLVVTLALLVVATGARAAANTAPFHDITVWHDPNSRALELSDTMTVTGRSALILRLAPWLTVTDALVDGQPRPAATHRQDVIRIALPDRGAHRVTLRAEGRVPALDDARLNGAHAVAGEEGSYLPAWSGWLPLTDDPWLAYRLAVAVPSPYRAVATGRLVVEREEAGRTSARFEATFPAEPPSLFVGPYRVEERRDAGVRIRTYFHADVAEHAAPYLEAAGRYIARYAARIGPYPFHDFHVISAPIPVGLGFPTLTYVGRRVIPHPFMRGRSLAHEVLHNWWGNGVAIDYAGGNWSEGLTSFMADYALAEEEGPARAAEMRLGWLRNYAALPSARDHALVAFRGRRNDAAQVIGYDKAAAVFHMLRRHLGAVTFEAGLRRFWRERQFTIAGWDALQGAFEAASGEDLGWFFTQWVRRAGAPRLSLVHAAVSDDAAGHRVAVSVRQEAPHYRLQVPVRVETESGAVDRWFTLDDREATWTVTTASRPLAVAIDPAHDLFRALLPGEAPPILRDVTLSADPRLVVAAGGEAAETARALAERLLDGTPRERVGGEGSGPLLVIGTTDAVAAALATLDLGDVPVEIAGRGSARVWTLAASHPVLVVAANDAAALAALLRPLPHYRNKSYLVFEGRRAVETGVWSMRDGPLTHRFR